MKELFGQHLLFFKTSFNFGFLNFLMVSLGSAGLKGNVSLFKFVCKNLSGIQGP